jgi:hypothetical protein
MPDDEKIFFEVWCDLLKAELERAIDDIAVIRHSEKVPARNICPVLGAALNNAQFYYRKIEESLTR